MGDLTDKWKARELKAGSYYYVKTKLGNILIDCINFAIPNHNGFLYDVEEVIAPVPSYDEVLSLESDRLAKNEGEEIIAELENELEKIKEDIRLGRCFNK